tara:strand:- start:269 stop:493 length:225 start_codon:yes stop_codon:yes gene_type:complete
MSKVVNVEVNAKDFKNFEDMLKKFSKKVRNTNVITECLSRRYFKSKSELRNEKKRHKKRLIELQKLNDNDKKSK